MDKEYWRKYKEFWKKHESDKCCLCGSGLGECALFEVHKIMDSKYIYDGRMVLLCNGCLSQDFSSENLWDFMDFWGAAIQ